MKNIDLRHGDAMELIKIIEDKSIDLIITDPPYESGLVGGGSSRVANSITKLGREIAHLSKGYDYSILDDFCRVLKKINLYIFCNKAQIPIYLEYFLAKKCSFDIIPICKTDPLPNCNQKYVSSKEYIMFFRQKGVQLYGNFKSKLGYYVVPLNRKDKNLYGHPTIKPLHIIEDLIINSSKEGEVILDPFVGSGTTLVGAQNLNRRGIGFELDENYYSIALERLKGKV